MMEVQQRLACLSPTQRLSVHPSVHSATPSLKQLSPAPPALTLPLAQSGTPSHPGAMIIEASLRTSSATTPPDSPQQGETVPAGMSESPKDKYPLPAAEGQKEQNFAHEYPKEHGHEYPKEHGHEYQTEHSHEYPTEHSNSNSHNHSHSHGHGHGHPLWGQSSDMGNAVEEFSQCGMAREGVEDGPSSPGREASPRESEDSMLEEGESSGQLMMLQEEENGSYQDLNAQQTPNTPGGQECGDRRNRRKQTIEDIVRRIATTEPEDLYPSEEIEEEDSNEPRMELPLNRNPASDDEVDGAPLEISRHILNAQACAETAIKQSLQGSFVDGEEEEDEDEMIPEDEEDCYPPDNFLMHRNHAMEDPRGAEPRWEVPKLGSPFLEPPTSGANGGEGVGGEKKAGVTILPKTTLPSYPSPSMAGLHSSLPMPNISESAYSPHQYSSAKLTNSWFPNTLPHLFPFSPGFVDSPLGPKFLPFEGKILEVDKDYLKCNYCERTFRRQKNLENHVENTHQGKGGQRPKREIGDMYFKCTHCPYTTKHQSNLYVHLRIHTGERPYICGACGVQYSQSHSLKSHIINKHDGHMNYYIKEKRNRSPRGIGYMSTHINHNDHTIFKIPPPPVIPGMQQSNMDLVARAIEMAKNSLGEGQGPHPPLMPPQHPPSSMHGHSPMMSPNGHMSANHHHGLFPKGGPGFPFNGHFPPPVMPFPDLPANPQSAMMPQPGAKGHMGGGMGGMPPCTTTVPVSGDRSQLLNLSLPMPGMTSTPTAPLPPTSSSSSTPNNNHHHPHHLSPLSRGGKPLPSPAGTPTGAPKSTEAGDCAPMDLSTRALDRKDGPPCGGCSNSGKLRLLRMNVVRMLSILVPNLNFEEKGISPDSDSVDELLQDVIESNTHDDDMVH